MHIVFHDLFLDEYAKDPAARRGRLDKAWRELKQLYAQVEPDMAEEADIRLVHSAAHFDMLSENPFLFMMALLAAGGAITASELAMQGQPSFGLLRPPGHHASVDDCRGFCWFNNIAVAVERLRRNGRIEHALILDIDLHYGDGTAEIFSETEAVRYESLGKLERLSEDLSAVQSCDIIAVSAGFDRHLQDWGGLLATEDYRQIGRQVKAAADRLCPGRVFAVLEGGYNPDVLGPSIRAFLQGLDD